MATCIHGNVCKAWMSRTESVAPLSSKCPYRCEYFEELKQNQKELDYKAFCKKSPGLDR